MYKKITIALMAALILIAAPACASKKDEAVEAARAEQWLKQRGADPEKLARLNNRQIIEFKEAVERGDRSLTTDGKEIHIEPIAPIGPAKPDILFEYRNVSITLRHLGEKFRLQEEAQRPFPAAVAGG